MNLIPGVDTSEETLVLEQLAYQSALYLPLTDSAVNIQDNDTLRDIVSKTVSAIDRGEIKRSDIAEYQKYIKELVDIIEAHPKIGAAQIGQMSWTVIDKDTGKPFKENGDGRLYIYQ